MKTAHRNASRAKRYQANPYTWLETLAANSEPDPAHAMQITNMVRTSFELLKSGHGTAKDFNRLGAALNVALIRAEAIDPLAEQTIAGGMEAMRNCDRIWQKHGRYGFTGPDLIALADAVNLYEEILRITKPILMEQAAHEVARRMLNKAQGVEA